MNYKIYPKCLGMGDEDHITPLYFSSDGFFYPCCWADGPDNKDFQSLTLEKFRLENNDNISDIINSNEWNEFYSDLLDKPQNAPKVCKRFCGKSRMTKESI